MQLEFIDRTERRDNNDDRQPEQTGEIIAGKNPVLEALRSGRDMNKVWIAEGVQKNRSF